MFDSQYTIIFHSFRWYTWTLCLHSRQQHKDTTPMGIWRWYTDELF